MSSTPLSSSNLANIPAAIYYGQFARTEDLNKRIESRIQPSHVLEPNIGSRPTSTKYAYFPAIRGSFVAGGSTNSVSLQRFSNFVPTQMFNPGDGRGPISGYLSKVEEESRLRHLGNKLIKHGIDSPWQPLAEARHSTITSRPLFLSPEEQMEKQTHLYLDRQFEFTSPTTRISSHIGNDRFHNHTRTQLREPTLNNLV